MRLAFAGDNVQGLVVETSRDRSAWTVIADRSNRPPKSADGTWRINVPEIVALQVRVRMLTYGEPPCGVSELSALGRLAASP
ncbi:hypothetical protein ACFY1L_52620 [Streptomyces sp. NPDC001663]|uniref:hypothetical protein n=1 Tax=Streptomyces sp. NPDC001663 TaxID=3364597 RepID=UPI0036CFC2B7